MTRRTGSVILCMVAIGSTAALAVDVQRDPFRVPAPYGTQTAGTDGFTATADRPIDLRGILLAGERSLVNVAGRILAIGEEFEGYRLVEVREAEAVFVRGGVRRTVAVHPQENEQDERHE